MYLMSLTATQLIEQALDLSEEERVELLVRLLDSVGGATSSDTSDDEGAAVEVAWLSEARRRLSDLDAGRMAAVPWSEARSRIVAPKP